jgi:hypothetical protein
MLAAYLGEHPADWNNAPVRTAARVTDREKIAPAIVEFHGFEWGPYHEEYLGEADALIAMLTEPKPDNKDAKGEKNDDK